MKYAETIYTSTKSILKFPDHHVALAVTVDDEGAEVNSEGRKIVPAGTILGGGTLADNTTKVSKKNTGEAEGVLLNDVDVTYGSNSGAMLIHAFIATDKLPEAPTEEAITALKQITFIK